MGVLLRALPNAMRQMLDCAGVRSSGLEGLLKARVLSVLWLTVVRHWAKDDSPDMEATMAQLDKELAKVEPFGRRFFAHDEVISE